MVVKALQDAHEGAFVSTALGSLGWNKWAAEFQRVYQPAILLLLTTLGHEMLL